ncbi:hypothetical protein [Spirochaeta africana]|uniref:Uncharacterized protein n=1 Tax=Spirochaeta africana (strain ATCC 700263 / DSM 8902 / Z-7692) TaxID=889378 RepID=H9UJ59_SPIAZ|nr:hypothetical protein [Spirochaeta africana]AFG37552.1 hypothetical protein Spiaf_1491 [Spirochaeta africana DSM 8902]
MPLLSTGHTLESLAARIAFTSLGCAATATILYIFGSFQGITDAGLIILLQIIGWSAGVTVWMTFYSSAVLIVLRFTGRETGITGRMLRNLLQATFSLLLFVLQSYILLMTNNGL